MRLLMCLITFLIALALMTAGCTQKPSSTSLPDESKIQSSVTSGSTPETGSLDQVPAPPADIAVSAQINDKDQLDKTITVFFSGGKGQKMVKSSWIIMNSSDGRVERFSLEPKVQSEIILKGTNGEDIVTVYAEYFDGNTYKIAEKKVGGARLRV